MPNSELEDIENQIIELTKSYFDLKQSSENSFVPSISAVPVSGKVLDSEDISNMVSSSLEGWLTSGDFTDKFQDSIRNFLGVRHCLFVNSGSSANLLALSGLKKLYSVEDGSEVITSAVNFPTTLNPILQNNLRPVLVDAEMGSYNIDPNLIEEKITSKTVGIVLAHTLGNPFGLDKIKEICEKHNLFLMEDNCDAFGSKYNNQFTGTFGDVATLSFYPAHHITTGEGGAVFTNNTKLKKILESLRDWGRDCYCPPGEDNTCKKRFDWQLGGLPHGYDHKYIYSNIGYNLKASDMQAAIGLSQMDKLDAFINKRVENFNYLYKGFQQFNEFLLPEWNKNSNPSWFGFPLTLKEDVKFNRVELLKFYDERRIGTRLLFGGNITLQPAYQDIELGNPEDFPIANKIVNNTFWLGVYPGLTNEMLDFVINTTKEFLEQK
ncbi:MAG: lipopolysaccharide biosynthesis protein RfbH [Rhizobiales bacterium TMED94]|nr:MAG: lipopolysaccharide biosynthesis protein RfbH [Rhizobiales bacterium TMED94]|tara:strand:+ start:1499 stop:2806 length:1308 start_codon:yes stop_codon:yes gene_type:complete